VFYLQHVKKNKDTGKLVDDLMNPAVFMMEASQVARIQLSAGHTFCSKINNYRGRIDASNVYPLLQCFYRHAEEID